MVSRDATLIALAGLLCVGVVHYPDSQENMPRANVVQVPAIGKGLRVSNVLQANMGA